MVTILLAIVLTRLWSGGLDKFMAMMAAAAEEEENEAGEAKEEKSGGSGVVSYSLDELASVEQSITFMYIVYHPLVVDVSCVKFLTQSVCMIPKQNTQNIYHKQMNNGVLL